MIDIFIDQSNTICDAGNEIIYNTEVLKSSFSDYNDAYILVVGNIVTAVHNNLTPVVFKNSSPFIKCITTFIH